MKKISYLCFLSLIVGSGVQSVLAEQVEIVICVERTCQDEDSSAVCEQWDRMVENVAEVATKCEGCTSRSFDPMVDNMCGCIKEIASIMKTDPVVQGSISITVKDNEQGFQGKVLRR